MLQYSVFTALSNSALSAACHGHEPLEDIERRLGRVLERVSAVDALFVAEAALTVAAVGVDEYLFLSVARHLEVRRDAHLARQSERIRIAAELIGDLFGTHDHGRGGKPFERNGTRDEHAVRLIGISVADRRGDEQRRFKTRVEHVLDLPLERRVVNDGRTRIAAVGRRALFVCGIFVCGELRVAENAEIVAFEYEPGLAARHEVAPVDGIKAAVRYYRVFALDEIL